VFLQKTHPRHISFRFSEPAFFISLFRLFEFISSAAAPTDGWLTWWYRCVSAQRLRPRSCVSRRTSRSRSPTRFWSAAAAVLLPDDPTKSHQKDPTKTSKKPETVRNRDHEHVLHKNRNIFKSFNFNISYFSTQTHKTRVTWTVTYSMFTMCPDYYKDCWQYHQKAQSYIINKQMYPPNVIRSSVVLYIYIRALMAARRMLSSQT